MKADTKKLLVENQNLLQAAQQNAAKNGYRVSEINKAALEYIRVAKGLNLNCTEFTHSLKEASTIIGHSTSKSSLLVITLEDAKT